MNRYSLNTMMTFSYDNKGFLLLGNKTCDSHCNIKNVSTILFNMDHSPLALCLSSCVFCWFRDDLGTMQKVEIKPHQMAPGQIAWWIPKDVYLGCGYGRVWKSIWTSNQKIVGSTPIRSSQIFFSKQPMSLTKIIHLFLVYSRLSLHISTWHFSPSSMHAGCLLHVGT